MATVQSQVVESQPHTRFRITRLLALLSVFAFILNAEDSAVYAVIGAIQQEFHLTNFEASLIPAVEATGVIITALPLALLADRMSRAKIITWGLLFWGLFTVASGLALGLATLLIARGFMGLSMSGYDSSAQSDLNDEYPPQQRSRALAVQNTAENVGLVVGVTVEAILVSFLNWRSVFFSVSGLAFAAVMLAWFFLRDPIRGQFDPQPFQTPAMKMSIRHALREGFQAIRLEWRHIFGSFPQMIALFGRTAQQCAFLCISFFLSLFFIGYYGFNLTSAALMVTVFNGAGLVGALASGWVDRRLEVRFSRGVHFVVAGAAIVACGVLFFASLAFTLLPATIGCLVLAGVGMGGALPPLSTAIGDVNGANRRAFAYMAQLIPSWFISALVPIPIGILADTLASLKGSLMSFAGLLVVAGVALIFSYPRLNKEAEAFQRTAASVTEQGAAITE